MTDDQDDDRSPQVADTRDQRAIMRLFSLARETLDAMPPDQAAPLWAAAAAGRTTWHRRVTPGDPGRVILTAFIDGVQVASAATTELMPLDDFLGA